MLEVPADYRIGIVPASDTGAVEMALWSLLGARPVTMLAWESFGEGWVTDVDQAAQAQGRHASSRRPMASCPIWRRSISPRDVVFTWNGTTSGVRVPNGDWIAADREGLTICDATSAAFAQELDWPKLDVVTFSWQKALGGEGAHGMLVLSPRAVARLESYKPAWPLPKIFRLTKGGKLNEGIFAGETINTPSMLCVEDYLDTLALGEIGRRPHGTARPLRRQRQGDRRLGGAHALDRASADKTRPALQHLGVPAGRRSGGDAAFGRRRRPPSPRRWQRCWKRKASPTTSPITATRRPACASGAAPRSRRADVEALDALARLGLRRSQSRAAEGGVSAPSSRISGDIQEHVMPKVLISDALSPAAVQIFKDRGIEVDFQPALGKDKEKLAELIGDYDGLAIRSATKVTAKILEKAKNLKVIGRAGIGVDNVDIPAATARGIIVMNTPFGNSITTAEHAISLMLALARQIPEANTSTRAGKWEKNKFMGVEIFAKTLGVIGCGNIGSIVADRAIGLKMKVIAYDPFLSPERARDLGVEKVELDELFKRADFITLHTPLTEKTKNIIDAAAHQENEKGRAHHQLRARRPGGRGGAWPRRSIRARWRARPSTCSSRNRRPASPLFGLPNVVCTPHLGAATSEAQENVALQVAEQMSDYLLRGAISNAVNFPSISAEEAPKLKPFVALAEKLGSFAGQLTENRIKEVQITYEGAVAQMNIKALTSAALAGLLRPMLGKTSTWCRRRWWREERGIAVEETTRERPATTKA